MQHSPLFAKTEAFMSWLLNHTAGFNKVERFRLAKRIDDSFFNFHETISKAVFVQEKQPYFDQADFHLLMLRSYFRIALELQYTHPDKYRFAAEQIDELGRLLGGWIKRHNQP